eukprot:scpid46429/ scgid23136/ 
MCKSENAPCNMFTAQLKRRALINSYSSCSYTTGKAIIHSSALQTLVRAKVSVAEQSGPVQHNESLKNCSQSTHFHQFSSCFHTPSMFTTISAYIPKQRYKYRTNLEQ